MLQHWEFFVILTLIFNVLFTQFYKKTTITVRKEGALTVLLEWLGSFCLLFFLPFFSFKFPNTLKIFLYFGIILLLYTISDRISTTVRRGVEASVYGIIRQLSSVFLFFFGIIFAKEKMTIFSLMGALLLLLANFILLYQKGKISFNRAIKLGILGSFIYAVALFIDINIASYFNLAFYVILSLFIPSLIILVFEKISFKDIKMEIKKGNKLYLFLTAFSWGMSILTQLIAYQLGNITIVAPFCALAPVLNVFVSYFFLKEKDRLFTKIISGVLILLGIILIQM